jgi:hypothetical protein
MFTACTPYTCNPLYLDFRVQVVHFMAQSYRTSPSYYTEFWSAMERIPIQLLDYECGGCQASRVGMVDLSYGM